jgi:dTDP-4-dehydrorhamnose reductase
MRVLITGGTGMLGHKLYQRLSEKVEAFATIRGTFDDVGKFGIFNPNSIIENVDLTRDEDILKALDSVQPDVVINAAGVIKQIPSSKNVTTTLSINSILPHKLSTLGRKYGFRTIVVSTDCVFTGIKGNYSESDLADSRDLYGVSKKLGEVTDENCLTLRTSIIGRELRSKHSLVEWFLSHRGEQVKGFTHAIYSGFPTIVFADIIYNLLINFPNLSGLYHVSSDPIAKRTLLELVNIAFNANVKIQPDNTVVIDRSLNSSKFRKETSFGPQPWEEMVEKMRSDPTPYALFAK